MYQQVAARAEEVGLNFAEYVRHLLAGVIEGNMPMVDEETEQNLAASMKDYRVGKFEEIDPSDLAQLDRAAGITR